MPSRYHFAVSTEFTESIQFNGRAADGMSMSAEPSDSTVWIFGSRFNESLVKQILKRVFAAAAEHKRMPTAYPAGNRNVV
jgi:hypothetical protein